MSKNTYMHFSADRKDLSCPVCYCVFDLKENQPISANCGHTICSSCFGKVSNCPLCKVKFDKTQKHQKSVLLSSLIANSAKTLICKEHSNICQGVCRQDKVFVCFDCAFKSHQGHKIIPISDLNEKTKKIKTATQKIREKEKVQNEIKESLEGDNKKQKRKLDEIIDQEIFQLSMLKKKLYKEINIQTISDKEQQEHRFISENLSKYCKNAEKVLGAWDKTQDAHLAIQIMDNLAEEIPEAEKLEDKDEINLLKTSIAEKQEQFMNEITKNIGSISEISTRIKELFACNIQTQPALDLSQLELEYLIDVFRQFCFIVSCNNNVLELRDKKTKINPPKFDSSYFTCSLSKISLDCLDSFSNEKFHIISQILENITGLKDLTLQLQKLNDLKMNFFSNLLPNLKSLEKFQVEMDVNESIVSPSIQKFMRLKNLSSLDIQYKDPQIIISGQLIDQAKSLNALRLFFGKTRWNTQVLEAISEALRLQSNLEEFLLTFEDLNYATEMDLSFMLVGLTRQKKLGIFVNNVSRSNDISPTNFMVDCHLKDLEELTLKIKCRADRNPSEDFESLTEFLANSKRLKKLCLQFDGINLALNPTKKLFHQIVKLQNLVSVEIEFVNFNYFDSYSEKNLEVILNKLPSRVTRKYNFSKPNPQSNYVVLAERKSFIM